MSGIIKMQVSTGWAGGDHNDEMELPESWDEFTEEEKENFLNEVAVEYLHECCDSAAWVENE